MTTSPAVRPRLPADLPALVPVLREVHEKDRYPRNWPAAPETWIGGGPCLGAWVADGPDGAPVGHAALVAPGAGDVAPGLTAGPVAVVARLFVSPRARGTGTGRALLAHVAAAARELGLRAVLDVVAADTGSVAFYTRTGWEPLGGGEQDWGAGQLVPVRSFGAPPF
ncbi:GNAT family N-acetyltransferase [Streptomyces sp. NPDC004111]|uniref:GNAT family N-acetyltransferase n=1 Tax=Streptomyces sp. NPDC004111 TaxID=3364690 RepID=UPI0036A3CF9F